MKYILLLILFHFSQSCSSDSGLYKKSDSFVNHLLKAPVTPWSEINNAGSDYALLNSNTKSIFLFNSSCRKYESGTLTTLTASILAGIEQAVILERKNVFYQEREAAEVTASGNTDGIIRYFKIITIQKNNCIYDYILISTNKKNLEKDYSSLKIFLERIILI